MSGPPGTSGPTGQDGDRGPQGSQGSLGSQGQTGERGPPGLSRWGPRGDTGATGGRGPPGPRGGNGATGPKGLKGQRGNPGLGQKGQRGEPGYSNCRLISTPCYRKKRSVRTSDDNTVEINTPGVVYTRWGESSCPGNETKTVFSGRIASTMAANHLCLPSHYDHQHDETEPASRQANTEATTTATLYTSDVPCTVCLALKQSTVLTVPAKVTCPLGWTREYHGFVMNGSSEDGQYHCMDWHRGGSSKSWLDHVKVGPKIGCVESVGSGCSINNIIECAVCTL